MARSTRDRVGRPVVSRRALDRGHRAPAGAIARPSAIARSSRTPSPPAPASRSSTAASRSAAGCTCSRTTSRRSRGRPAVPAGPVPVIEARRSRSTRLRSTTSGSSTTSDSGKRRAPRRGRTCASPRATRSAATASSGGPSEPATCSGSRSTRARQGEGFGSALLTDGLHWMRVRGARSAFVNTQVENERALGLYERSGFRRLPVGLCVLGISL